MRHTNVVSFTTDCGPVEMETIAYTQEAKRIRMRSHYLCGGIRAWSRLSCHIARWVCYLFAIFPFQRRAAAMPGQMKLTRCVAARRSVRCEVSAIRQLATSCYFVTWSCAVGFFSRFFFGSSFTHSISSDLFSAFFRSLFIFQLSASIRSGTKTYGC